MITLILSGKKETDGATKITAEPEFLISNIKMISGG